MIKDKKYNFDTVASNLEERATRLSQENNPRNLGNDEIVFSVAQFICVLGNASKTTNRFTWAIIFLTIINVVLVII